MKLRRASLVAPLLVLVACSSSSTTTFSVSSGTYKLSSVAAVAPDNCNLALQFADGDLVAVDVANGAATFRLNNQPPDPTRNPVCTVNGNSLDLSPAKTYNSATTATCTETITVTVQGELLADDTINGTLRYQSDAAAGAPGAACTATGLQYKALPCASTLTFQAKKQ
jgi:hypothetical protein